MGKPVVGQKIWIMYEWNFHGVAKREAVVARVGRKYFYVVCPYSEVNTYGLRYITFLNSEWKEPGECIAWHAFETEAAVDAEWEMGSVIRELRKLTWAVSQHGLLTEEVVAPYRKILEAVKQVTKEIT